MPKPRSQLRPVLSVSLTFVALLLSGCDDDPIRPEQRVHTLEPLNPPAIAWTGTTVPVGFRALDEAGRGVEGVRVQFEVTHGSGSLSASASVTDSLGRVEVRLAVARPGNTGVAAQVRGLGEPVHWLVTTLSRPNILFQRDSLVLAAPGCEGTLFAQVLDDSARLVPGGSVAFENRYSGVISLSGITTTGTVRGMLTRVRALRAGTDHVTATHASGAADTATVRVATDSVARFYIAMNEGSTASPSEYEMAPGDTVHTFTRAEYPACEPEHSNGPAVPGVSAIFRSSDPSVATVSESGVIAAHALGTAATTAEWREFGDTLSVRVKGYRIEPMDTTVAPGDTIRYRAVVTDVTGATTILTTDRTGLGTSDESVVQTVILPDGSHALIARSPGEAAAGLYLLNKFRTARVRVIAR